MSGVEWTDEAREAARSAIDEATSNFGVGYMESPVVQDVADAILTALVPHVEARVRQAEAERDAALARLAKVRELVERMQAQYMAGYDHAYDYDDLRAALGGEEA